MVTGIHGLTCKCSRSLCVFFRSSKQRLHRLAFVRATELVLPFEDIIAFGDVAFDDVVHSEDSSNVLAVSAMKHGGRYLVALSARDGAAPMQVTVNASSSSGFELLDVIRGTKMALPGGSGARVAVQQRANESVALVVLSPS